VESAKAVDLILYVLDGHEGVREEDFSLMRKYKELGLPMAVAYTKIDIMPKENIPLDMAKFADSGIDLDVFPVSARKGRNIKNLREFLISSMPEGGKVFEEEIVSDKSERFMIAEIMREKILLKYDKEIPHGVAVVVNYFPFGRERRIRSQSRHRVRKTGA